MALLQDRVASPRALLPQLLAFASLGWGRMGLERYAVQPGYAHEVDEGRFAAQRCVSRHAVESKGGGIGPTFVSFGVNWRLTQRRNAPEYTEQVARVDALDEAPSAS